MISFDTNLLLYSLNQDCAEYNDARAFSPPAVLSKPLDSSDAVALIQTFREHPTWPPP